MSKMLDTFKAFSQDKSAWDMYVTGPAGTGKTTGLAECVQYCIDNGISYVVTAYTHKACGVLRSKLPEGALIQTLHSFIKKRPIIDGDATSKERIQQNVKTAAAEKVEILFVDEYSTVGERDLNDIRAEQDDPESDLPCMQVVWLGDANQLPPVNDMEAIIPEGPYQVKLTHVYRQGNDNPLSDTLSTLVKYIEGRAKPKVLEANAAFVRGVDLIETYKTVEDAVLLAFTNKRVEELNKAIQGYDEPEEGDKLFSPTTKHYYRFIEYLPAEAVYALDRPFGEPLLLGSKYKTLEYITQQQTYTFARVHDLELDEEQVVAFIFGHSTYKLYLEQLKFAAASVNKRIESKYKVKAAHWAKNNFTSPLGQERAQVWRDFLSFNECVICLDFAHAMTVHKSQGSTFKNVIVDSEDIGICADRNFSLYLRLLYVALSRASSKAYTN